MNVRGIIIALALGLLAGCGGSLSEDYVKQELAKEGLQVSAIVPVEASLGGERWIVFVESADEKGCFIFDSTGSGISQERVTNERAGSTLNPGHPVVMFRAWFSRAEYLCISIQDPALNASVSAIEARYPDFMIHEAVTAGQSHYVLSHPTNTGSHPAISARFYGADGTLLYEQDGETK